MEAIIIGEKGYFDCPVRLELYGTSDVLARAALEQRLKNDRLLKANQMKQTRKENEQRRKPLGLKSGGSGVGLGPKASPSAPSPGSASPGPGVSMQQLMQASQAMTFRDGEDAIQTLAMNEEQLVKLPKADQPDILRAQLLPYQLQVSSTAAFYLRMDLYLNLFSGPCLDESERRPSIPCSRF